MAKHIVKCRLCKEHFDAKEEEKDQFWVMPSRNFYYHKSCYLNWKKNENLSEEDYRLLIYDLIARDLKGKYNYAMIEAQLKKFLATGKTNKGIYYTLVWHHISKKQPWKEEYGIGLVPNIYEKAKFYWAQKERLNKNIFKQHEKLVKDKMEKEPIPIKIRKKRKRVIKAPE